MPLQGVDVDGIQVQLPGWTNQSTSPFSTGLESYSGSSSINQNAALKGGYNAWTCEPFYANGTAPSINNTTYAVRVYVPANFNCTKLDYINVTGTESVTVGLWPATAPAGTATPLAWSAATVATAGALQSLTWNGSSSPLSVALTGGQFYMVTLFGSAVTGTVAAQVGGTAYETNAGYSGTTAFSTTTTYQAATVTTLAGTLTAASVFGTSTLIASNVWVGLH
jgi:hypothetical protein